MVEAGSTSEWPTSWCSLRVDIPEVLLDSKTALQPVLAATPGWDEEAAAAATVNQISGALTNLVYRCMSRAAARNGTVIVRVFGSGEKLFSAKDEHDIFMLASALGLGPQCLVEYENGRVEQFLPGASLSCKAMRDGAVSAGIAAALAEFHVRMTAGLPADQQAGAVHATAVGAAATASALGGNSLTCGSGANGGGESAHAAAAAQQDGPLINLQPAIYERVRQWYAAAQQLCGEEELADLCLANLPDEVEALRSRMQQLHPPWIGFCHNDLQYGNILLLCSDSTADGNTGGNVALIADGATGEEGIGGDGSNSAGGARRAAGAAAAAGAAGAAGAAAPPAGSGAVSDGLSAPLAADGTGAGAANGEAGNNCHACPNTPGGADIDASSAIANGSVAALCSGGLWVKLIDYEYSTPNDVAFDLANHFCEWAYDYHSDEAHTFHGDWLPSEGQQLHFCRAYVAAMQWQAAAAAAVAGSTRGDGHSGRQHVVGAGSQQRQLPDAGARLAHCILTAATEGHASSGDGGGVRGIGGGEGDGELAARLLQCKAQAHMCLSHLKWGLWGLIQDKTSDVDFDYLSYARQRIERYHAAKCAILEAAAGG